MVRSSLFVFGVTAVPFVAAGNPYWDHKGQGPPWRARGAQDTGRWFTEFENTLKTLQDKFFIGSTWPDALQWQTAVLDTLLLASDDSFTNALQEYNGQVPGTSTSAASLTAETKKYFAQTESFYNKEDTNQIFDAAYDDAQWVVLEWMEAIKFINHYDSYANSDLGKADIARFAHRAHIFYNIVQDKYDTSQCEGGITWNPHLLTYKNAITNELLISSSIKMYLYFPGDTNTDPYPSPTYKSSTGKTLPPLPALKAHDPLLLKTARDEYNWFKTHDFTNAQGLVVDGFHISSGQTKCDQRNEMVYTYNQGVMLSGLRGLWEATGDATYLTDGYAYINSAINATGWNARNQASAGEWAGLGRNGIMEDYCDADGSCSDDAQLFKGIYFHHLDQFCEPLPTDKPLVAGLTKTASAALAKQHTDTCGSYTAWVEHNADAAISTRDSTGVIGQWWGASYANKTAPAPQYAAKKPAHSMDELNEPWLLKGFPWTCLGQKGCHLLDLPKPFDGGVKKFTRSFGGLFKRAGNQRTAKTQGSGLGVVKAASDFTVKRPAV